MNRRWQRWNVRPGTRSLASRPRRARYTGDDIVHNFELGLDIGVREGRKFALDDMARTREALEGFTDDQLAELEAVADEELALADAAGVTPIDPATIDGEALADDVEQYLRGLDDGAA